MAEEAEETKEGAESEAAPPKKSKKMLIVIIVVVLLLAVGGGAAYALLGKKGISEDEELLLQDDSFPTETVDLETFVVNLSENATFLKTTIVLEVNSNVLHGAGHKKDAGHGGSGMPGVLGEHQAKITDRILRILSSKKAPQLLDPEGKDELRQELADAINQVVELDEDLVTNVYFVTFIIQ